MATQPLVSTTRASVAATVVAAPAWIENGTVAASHSKPREITAR